MMRILETRHVQTTVINRPPTSPVVKKPLFLHRLCAARKYASAIKHRFGRSDVYLMLREIRLTFDLIPFKLHLKM